MENWIKTTIIIIIILALIGYNIYNTTQLEYYKGIYQEKHVFYDAWNISSIDDDDNYYENLGFKNTIFHSGKNGDTYNIWWKNTEVNESISFWFNINNSLGELKINGENYNLTK